MPSCGMLISFDAVRRDIHHGVRSVPSPDLIPIKLRQFTVLGELGSYQT